MVVLFALSSLCSNYGACFVSGSGEDGHAERDGLNKAVALYQAMRADNVEIRSDLEMCNLLRTALRVLADKAGERDQFVRWWLKELDTLNVQPSSYAIREIVQNGVSLNDVGIHQRDLKTTSSSQALRERSDRVV